MSGDACPCGAGTFGDCCGPYLRGARLAASPEALMRSRYTAYALRDAAYLLATWHPLTRPAAVEFAPGQRWLGLTIRAVAGTVQEGRGVVEFVARYKVAGRAHRHCERSEFVSAGGRWYYLQALPG